MPAIGKKFTAAAAKVAAAGPVVAAKGEQVGALDGRPTTEAAAARAEGSSNVSIHILMLLLF